MFSDPPINTASVTKVGARFILNDRVGWDTEGAHAGLPDGSYTMGIRPHHVTPHGTGPGTVELEGTVLVTELSGSESVVHFDLDGQTWISQSHGIHPLKIGSAARFCMDIGKSKLFDLDDKLVAA